MGKTQSDPVLVDSDRSCLFERDGHTVEVCIYRLEDSSQWTLEVVNEHGTSTVWDESFSSDDLAWNEFLKTVEEEGITEFIDASDRGLVH